MYHSTLKPLLPFVTLFNLLAFSDGHTTSKPNATMPSAAMVTKMFTSGQVIMLGPLTPKTKLMLISAEANVYVLPSSALSHKGLAVKDISAPVQITDKWPPLSTKPEYPEVWKLRQNVVSMIRDSNVRVMFVEKSKDGSSKTLILDLDINGGFSNNTVKKVEIKNTENKGIMVSTDMRSTLMFIRGTAGQSMHAVKMSFDQSSAPQILGSGVLCGVDGGKKVHFLEDKDDCKSPIDWPLRNGIIYDGHAYLFTATEVISFEWDIFTNKSNVTPVTRTDFENFIITLPKPHYSATPKHLTEPNGHDLPKAKSTTESRGAVALIAVIVTLVIILVAGIAIFFLCCKDRSPTDEKTKAKDGGDQMEPWKKKTEKKKKSKTHATTQKKSKTAKGQSSSKKGGHSAKSTAQKVAVIASIRSSNVSSYKAGGAFKSNFNSKSVKILAKSNPKSNPKSNRKMSITGAMPLGSLTLTAAGSSAINPASSVLSKKSSIKVAKSSMVFRGKFSSDKSKSAVGSSVASQAVPDRSVISKLTVKKSRK